MHDLLAAHLSKTSSVSINGAEDLDVVMTIHNLIECRKNFKKRTANLWNYYRNKPVDPLADPESFKCKRSIVWKAAADGDIKDVKFVVPLKYFSNFWRTLDMPLINCDMNLILTCSKDCVITDRTTRVAGAQVSLPEIRAPVDATLVITGTKLYVPVSIQDNNKLLQKLKTGFKRTIKCDEHKSGMSNQTRNNNLNYLIDPTFIKVI